MRNFAILTLLPLLVLATPSQASVLKPPPLSAYADTGRNVKAGMTLSESRTLLVKQGWKPYITHKNPVPEGEDGFPYVPLERDLINHGIKEISSCSEGRSFCNFYYIQRGECFMLTTEGESIKLMRLAYWGKAVCPKDSD